MISDSDKKDKVSLSFHPAGDAMARLRAMGAYAFIATQRNKSKSDVEMLSSRFCRDEKLHQETLNRSMDLRKQIQRIAVDVFRDLSIDNAWSFSSPPTAEEDVILRQIMITGYADCIARRAPAGVVKEGSRRRRLTAYISCDSQVSTYLYIHPHSALYNKDPTGDLSGTYR
jgi:ATP-dependent RNA helicase DHX37/DHR1